MINKLQQVIRAVMLLYRRGLCKQYKARRGGGLLVLLSTSPGLLTHRRITCTVAAAGPWFASFKNSQNVVLELFSFISLCDCPHQEELRMFSDNFESLHFTCSFQVDQVSQDVESEAERFLQRVSLVNSQITIIFKVKNKERTWQRVFSCKTKKRQPVMDYFFSSDSTTSSFSVGCFTSCCRRHLVLGESIPLLLPSEAVEAGLCGEMSVTSLASLIPCMKQFPNWPTRLSHIHVLVYGHSGIPIMQGEGQSQLSFLNSLADPLFWRKLGLADVHCAEASSVQGPLFYEMEFSTEDKHSQETAPPRTQAVNEHLKSEVCPVEQNVTLFLLVQYRDPFYSQLSDFITSEEILERQLDRVFCHNADKVRSSLQTLLENTLREFLRRTKSRVKLESAMSVILSSVNSIVSSSSSAVFRSACMNSMKVQNTNDLSASLHHTLQSVIGGRFVSSITCTAEKSLEADVSEKNGSERLKQCHSGERGLEESSLFVKRWCSGTIDCEWNSPKSSLESLDSQKTSLSSSQQSLRQNEMDLFRTSATSEGTPELKNQQIEREWLQELEHLSEWD